MSCCARCTCTGSLSHLAAMQMDSFDITIERIENRTMRKWYFGGNVAAVDRCVRSIAWPNMLINTQYLWNINLPFSSETCVMRWEKHLFIKRCLNWTCEWVGSWHSGKCIQAIRAIIQSIGPSFGRSVGRSAINWPLIQLIADRSYTAK